MRGGCVVRWMAKGGGRGRDGGKLKERGEEE